MQHDRWLRHGRRYHHQDEGKPTTVTLTTEIGELNVDVNGDGQTFAPYVLSGASLRHGDSECVFAEGWQEIKRLGQTLVSQSRLYVQRDIAGTWTDVPHGIPTRNVTHGYPSEGRCTAYLDFDQIQGYAAGARLQVGIEVGGGDRQTYGFRFRSPVAGTFRLEWVLEIPENVDLAWITTPTSRTDPTPIRVGGRIGQVEIHWSRAEAPFRSATVETIAGSRILHLLFGPYTVAAQEWLTIYPDTFTPTINANTDDGNDQSGTWAVSGTADLNYIDSATHVGLSFVCPGALASTVTVSKMYARMYTHLPLGGTAVFKSLVENSDPATAAIWATGHLPSGGSWIRANANESEAFAATTWYFGEADANPINLAADLQDLLTAFGDIATGNRINPAYLWQSGGYVGFEDYNDAGTNHAQLLITYTAGGAQTPPVQASYAKFPIQKLRESVGRVTT